MRSDDLVPLLTPPPSDGLGFRQGEVISFNADTGSNTIQVGGTTLVDVPMLNSGEAIALSAGHVVALLTWKSSWWILGRVTLPNSGQFASAAVTIKNAGGQASDFLLNTTQRDQVTATVDVPPWADQATVMCIGHAEADNDTANDAQLKIMTRIESVNSAEMRQMVFAGQQSGQVGVSNHAVIFNLGSTLTVATQVWTQSGTWSGYRTAIVTATAFFQSNA